MGQDHRRIRPWDLDMDTLVLEGQHLQSLLDALVASGYQPIGPVVRGGSRCL